jgi:Holliday junction resolvase RusA-like endonuclease
VRTDLPERVVCRVLVPGDPASKGRPRFFNGRVLTPKSTRLAERSIQQHVFASDPRSRPVADAAMGVRLAFYTRTKRRRDIDNLVKLVFDACNGRVWADDNQIEFLLVKVVRGDSEPRTEMTVWLLDDQDSIAAQASPSSRSRRSSPSPSSQKRPFCP